MNKGRALHPLLSFYNIVSQKWDLSQNEIVADSVSKL